MVMNRRRPFADTAGSTTDDRAYLIDTRSVALLRIAPVILIALALVVGVLSLWIDPNGDRLIRLSEMVIAGALGSLTSVFAQGSVGNNTINVDNPEIGTRE